MIDTTTAGGVQPSRVCSVYDQYNHCRRSSTFKGLQCLWSIQPLQKELSRQGFVVFMISTTTAGGVQPSRVCSVYDQYNPSAGGVQPSRVCSVYDQYNHCRRSSTFKGLQCLWSIQPLQEEFNLQGFVVFMIDTTTAAGVQPSRVCSVYEWYNHFNRQGFVVFMINMTTAGGVLPSRVCSVYDRCNYCRRSSTFKGL